MADKQEDFNPLRGFAGPAPGQNIDHVLARLTKRDLELLVGPAVLPLLPSAPDYHRRELEVAAARVMADRGRKVLSASELRRTILRNLDPGKLSELSHRLGADAGSVTVDDETWSIFAGFLGLDQPDAAGAYAMLPVEQVGIRYGLFSHQRSVVRRVMAKIGDGQGRTLVHMPTGARDGSA